jgi:hypothetical protein
MSENNWFTNDVRLPIRELIGLESSYRIDSLISAMEALLTAKEGAGLPLTNEEFVVLSVEAMEREVNNGGFHQFFSNSSVRFAPRLVSSLERIGATKTQKLANRVLALVGVESSVAEIQTIDDISDAVQKRLNDNDEAADILSDIDTDYYDLDEDIVGLLFTFVKGNVEKFD